MTRALASLAAVVVFTAGCTPDDDAAAVEATPLTAIVQPVAMQDRYQVERQYVGTAEPARELAASFDLAGRIDLVAFDEGDRVAARDRIASLDTDRLRAQRDSVAAQRQAAEALLAELQAGPRIEAIAAARAAVTQREAELELAQITTTRQTRLSDRGAASGQRADEAEFNAAALRAAVAAAKAQLEELETGTRPEKIDAQQAQVRQLEAELNRIDVELTRSVLLAPFDAVVTERLADEGTTVAAGQAVLRLIESGRWQVRVGVPADVAATLAIGDELPCRLRETDFAGRVVRIRPDRLDATRTVPVLLAVEPPKDGSLFSGDLVRVRIDGEIAERGFWLPIGALVEGVRGLWACYVPRPLPTKAAATHELERVPLEMLTNDGERAYVRGPIRDGELVVTVGVHRLVPGQLVTLRDAGQGEDGADDED